ncbi:UDP-N,N'-diacetylbacillosamine 2-epimerase (hydrolyzing) [compost metagenome]
MGNMMRIEYERFISRKLNVIGIESFGTKGYFTCMRYAKYLIGNTSSGIIEAASFGKYVINIGDRQKGRAISDNIIQVQPNNKEIVTACKQANELGIFTGENVYYKDNVSSNIIGTLTDIIKQNAGRF